MWGPGSFSNCSFPPLSISKENDVTGFFGSFEGFMKGLRVSFQAASLK